jgi:AraC-like DNA-binding protein
VVTVAGSDVVLDTGDAYLVQSDEVHQLRPTPALEPFEVLWWHATTRGISLPVVRFEAHGAHLDVFHGGFVAVEPSPAAALTRVALELRLQQAGSDLLVRAIMLQLTTLLVRGLGAVARGPDPSRESGRNSSWHVQRVADYVRAHYSADLSLKRLADLVNVSPYYLTTIFRRYLGRSAMAYVGEVRHRHACELLRDTDADVAEVARRVGYHDPFYFSRVFKAGEGCSPLMYRRRHRPVTPSTAPDAPGHPWAQDSAANLRIVHSTSFRPDL